MITRSETSTNQSGSVMNRPGSAAQSGSEMNRSGSLRTYLIMEYGEQTQRLVKNYGKELDRQAWFANHHHFNLRCVKSGIVPSSLRIASLVSTERARSAAKRVSRVFAQERVKTSLWAKNSASVAADKLRSRLQEELSTEDFDKITRICDKTAENTFASIKERHQRKFDTLAGFKLFVVSVLLVSNWLVFSVSSFSVSGTKFFSWIEFRIYVFQAVVYGTVLNNPG